MTRYLKLYGERNTNTNYLSVLIDLNLDVVQLPGVAPAFVRALQRRLPGSSLVRDVYFRLTYARNLGWKHTRVAPTSRLERYSIYRRRLAIVTLTKNPYSWLLSLYRNPYHQHYEEKPGFEDFLRRPWKTVGRDNLARTVESPVTLWNEKNAAYRQLDETKSLRLTSESLLADPEAAIVNIARKFEIPGKAEEFIDYEVSTKDPRKDAAYYRDYYLKERWRADLSEEAVELINRRVDREVMASFGYQLIL